MRPCAFADSSGPRSGGRRLTPESTKRAAARFPRLLVVWGPAVAWAAVLFLLSELRGVPLNATFATNDKLIHVAMYAVMGSALGWAWFASRRNGRAARHGVAIGLGLLYGGVDEIHQYFVPGRMPSVADWIADAVGVLLGYLVALAVLNVWAGRQARATVGRAQ